MKREQTIDELIAEFPEVCRSIGLCPEDVAGRRVGIAMVVAALAHAERAETFLPETRRAARQMRRKLERISGVRFKPAVWPRKLPRGGRIKPKGELPFPPGTD